MPKISAKFDWGHPLRGRQMQVGWSKSTGDIHNSTVVGLFDTWDNGSRLGRVMVKCTLFMTHCLRLNLQLHTISLVRTCHISSFCTVAWQLARLLLTRRIARSLSDSWASCTLLFEQLAFRALTLLVGLQVGHPAWKNWVIRCWCGYLSGARCRLFASQPLIISCLI